MTYRDAVRKLIALGCQEITRPGRGSHRKWLNPTTKQATILPDRGGRDLKIGTIRGAVRSLGLDWQEFLKT